MKKNYSAPDIKVIKMDLETVLLTSSETVITTRPSQGFKTGANDYIGTGTDNGDFMETDEID